MSNMRMLITALLAISLAIIAEGQQLDFDEPSQFGADVPREAYYQPNEVVARVRRQITMPAQAPQSPPSSGLGFLSDIGPQVERVKVFSSLFNFGQGQQPAAQPAAASSGASASQIMGQLSELVRSTQDRSAKALTGAQQDVAQQTQTAQTGLQAALTEMVQGLQKIAMTNPSLLPEVKNLYSNVSSKLSSTTSSINQQPLSSSITPAKTGDQLADNLAKVALPGLQTPA